MKGYLLDTSVLSLLAPGRAAVPSALSEWLRAWEDRLFVPTITVAEIEQGIRKLYRTGASARAADLAAWLAALIEAGADRILSFDTAAAMIAGRISDDAIAKGCHPGFADVAIAATAAAHELVVLTTNGRHFEPLEIAFLDPSAADFPRGSQVEPQ